MSAGRQFGEGGESRPTTRSLNPVGVSVRDRLRSVNSDRVKELAASFREIGQLEPITVRPDTVTKTGYTLIVGAHRLAAAKLLKWESIAAIVVDTTDNEARLAEIDENLVRSELTPAERAMHVAERKRIYEELHPETKHGGDRKKSSRQVGDLASDRFTADAAEKTGASERAIQRDASRGTKIKDLDKVVGTSLDKGEELDALKKLPLSEQALLISRAAQGEQVSARKAAPKAESDGLAQIKRLWNLLSPSEQTQFLEWAGWA